MIFKQYHEILTGQKTETRRVAKPHEVLVFDGNLRVLSNGRRKWVVGRDYAAVPKYQKPAWWLWDGGEGRGIQMIDLPKESVMFVQCVMGTGDAYPTAAEANKWLASRGALQARIVIDHLHKEPVQDIDDVGAIAEGVANVEAYEALWRSINTKRGTRWEDNPGVWVIRFHVPQDVRDLYALWREQEAA